MKLPASKIGYTLAGATVFAALLVPFLLTDTFTKVFQHLGLHVDDMYSGGPKVRTVQMTGYSIDVHRPVFPHILQREKPFVQLDWRPVAGLPQRISDTVDVYGDGQPDVRVTFAIPTDAKVPLRADVDSLSPRYQTAHNLGRQKFSSLIVRVDEAILVRVPLARE